MTSSPKRPAAALLCIVVITGSSAGCHRKTSQKTPSSASAPVVPPSVAQPKPALPTHLIWGYERDAKPDASFAPSETFEASATPPTSLVLDKSGSVIATYPGIFIAYDGAIWRWSATTLPVRTERCEDQPQTEKPAPGSKMRATLLRLGAPARAMKLRARLTEDRGNSSYDHRVFARASLGPFVFVREDESSYACGAHGNENAFAEMIDLRTYPKRAAHEPAVAAWERGPGLALAKSEIEAEVKKGWEELEPDAAAKVSEYLPTYNNHGALEFRYRFVFDACYACGDGAFGSYSRSVSVAGPVPESLRDYQQLPPAVARYRAAHPAFELHGWSEVTMETADALAQMPDAGRAW